VGSLGHVPVPPRGVGPSPWWLRLGGRRSRGGEDAWNLRRAKTVVKLLALAPRHRLQREQVPVAHSRPGDRRDDVLSLCAAEPVWIDAEVFRDEAVAALRSRDAERAPAAPALFGGQLVWALPTPDASSRPARGCGSRCPHRGFRVDEPEFGAGPPAPARRRGPPALAAPSRARRGPPALVGATAGARRRRPGGGRARRSRARRAGQPRTPTPARPAPCIRRRSRRPRGGQAAGTCRSRARPRSRRCRPVRR
jgi:hypothetical protein